MFGSKGTDVQENQNMIKHNKFDDGALVREVSPPVKNNAKGDIEGIVYHFVRELLK